MTKIGFTRALVRSVIPDLYKTFRSATKAAEFLKEFKLTYRRKDFLADWREILGIEKKKDTWKYIKKTARPSPDMFTPSALPLREKYLYLLEYRYIDVHGNFRTREISFYSKSLLPIGEIEKRGMSILKKEQKEYGIKEYIDIVAKGGKTWIEEYE